MCYEPPVDLCAEGLYDDYAHAIYLPWGERVTELDILLFRRCFLRGRRRKYGLSEADIQRLDEFLTDDFDGRGLSTDLLEKFQEAYEHYQGILHGRPRYALAEWLFEARHEEAALRPKFTGTITCLQRYRTARGGAEVTWRQRLLQSYLPPREEQDCPF